VIRHVLPADEFRVVTYETCCRANTSTRLHLEDLAADGAGLLDHLGERAH
jgi:hypothetical protein